MSTAVWIVMCSEPMIRAPASGFSAPYSSRQRHEAGHLELGELDLLAAPLGEREIGDLEVGGAGAGGGVAESVVVVMGLLGRRARPGAHGDSRESARITG